MGIARRFGSEFLYENRNGRPAIDKRVLRAFSGSLGCHRYLGSRGLLLAQEGAWQRSYVRQTFEAAAPARAGGDGDSQPDTERQQHRRDYQVEHPGSGQQFDPDDRSADDAGHGSGDEHQGETAAGLALLPVPVHGAGVANTL